MQTATKQKPSLVKPKVVKPKAKIMDPKKFKGTYKYDRDAKIQIKVPKNPKREGDNGSGTRFIFILCSDKTSFPIPI